MFSRNSVQCEVEPFANIIDHILAKKLDYGLFLSIIQLCFFEFFNLSKEVVNIGLMTSLME